MLVHKDGRTFIIQDITSTARPLLASQYISLMTRSVTTSIVIVPLVLTTLKECAILEE